MRYYFDLALLHGLDAVRNLLGIMGFISSIPPTLKTLNLVDITHYTQGPWVDNKFYQYLR